MLKKKFNDLNQIKKVKFTAIWYIIYLSKKVVKNQTNICYIIKF